MMKRETSEASAPTDAREGEWLEYDCLICTSAIDVFGVFDCGHYSCAICALRVFRFAKAADKVCPMCRQPTKDVRVVTMTPHDEWSFDMADLRKKPFYMDKVLKISVESKELQHRLTKLYSFLCPLAGCWDEGQQDPFTNFSGLKEHLKRDHSLKYCSLCIEHRPSFLCEQVVYSDSEFDAHNRGKCGKDLHSFFGHPLCLFCSSRFYDGDQLLKHMQSSHFSCDVCNRGEFTFVFYKNRSKLIDHFSVEHRLCTHPDCRELDPMARVFGSDLELLSHEQRVHGAASRTVPLESLGFSYGSGGRSGGGSRGSSSPQPAPSSEPMASSNPATGRDVHAATIWFDNVSKRESVSTMPRTKHRTTTSAVKQAHHEVHLCTQVIPEHYETKELRDKIKRQVSRIDVAEKAAPHPVESPTSTSKIPDNLSPEEYNTMLKDKFAKYIKEKSTYEELKRMSADFMTNKLMATQYYRELGKIFPREQLDDIFEPLAYSLPNETKRAALIAARAMMNTAEERQRTETVRKEAESKAKSETLKSKQTLGGWKPRDAPAPQSRNVDSGASKYNPASPKTPGGSAARGAGQAKAGTSVWTQKSEQRAATVSAPTLSSGKKGPQRPHAQVAPTPASLIGELPTAEVPSAVLPTETVMARGSGSAYVDPDDFPSLGSSSGQQKRQQPRASPTMKKGGQASNAWFRK